jgi:septal ring factor EnvC (AmiA/AmiB activator)
MRIKVKHFLRGAVGVGLVLFCVLLNAVGDDSSSKDQDIQSKKQELERLRRQIAEYEKKIADSQKKEESTLEILDNFDRQIALIRNVVRRLKEDEKDVQNEIRRTETGLAVTRQQISDLKNEYARYVVSVYTQGKIHDLELIFSSRSLNQMYIRLEYLQHFARQRELDVNNIKLKQSNLEEKTQTLTSKLAEQQELLTSKVDEEDNLGRKIANREHLLESIRRDRKNYQHELNRKTQAAKQLENIIADLIEREKIQREHERLTKTPPKPKPKIDSKFANRTGDLPWPVSGRTVVAHFGNRIHPVLKTVTVNSGIDISAPPGSDVRAVAGGEVALIYFLPGYGNLVIVNHYDGYRTVYAHLSEILVAQGQNVQEGQVIAKSSDSISGTVLHFEIWKEREKQDPEQWLSKK